MTNTYLLDLRNQEVGGAVMSGHLYRVEDDLDVDWDTHLDEFTRHTSGRRLLVLVHGYNNSRSFARERLVRFGRMLADGGCSDTLLAVLWPGDGWAKALTYPFEGKDADDSADALFKWLDRHAGVGARLAFVGHSLGCRVVMNTAQRVAGHRRLRLDRICLMAPAIDNDSLGRLDPTSYQGATLAADRIAVLASEEDGVLRFAYPLGDLVQTVLYGERWGRALGRSGPVETDPPIVDRIEPVPRSDPERDIDHGDYLDAEEGAEPPRTIAQSEAFILEFLARAKDPYWPAQR